MRKTKPISIVRTVDNVTTELKISENLFVISEMERVLIIATV